MSISPDNQESLFIRVAVADDVVQDTELAANLTEVCPVDIFGQAEDGTVRIVEENLDECVLCRLCIDATPEGTVRVIKLYEDGAELRSGD